MICTFISRTTSGIEKQLVQRTRPPAVARVPSVIIKCAKLISLNRKKISRGIRLIPFSKNILPSTSKT